MAAHVSYSEAIASALLGFASYGDDAESSGTKPIKVVGLVLLAVSILFCFHAISTFYKRQTLQMKAGGYDSSSAAIALAEC